MFSGTPPASQMPALTLAATSSRCRFARCEIGGGVGDRDVRAPAECRLRQSAAHPCAVRVGAAAGPAVPLLVAVSGAGHIRSLSMLCKFCAAFSISGWLYCPARDSAEITAQSDAPRRSRRTGTRTWRWCPRPVRRRSPGTTSGLAPAMLLEVAVFAAGRGPVLAPVVSLSQDVVTFLDEVPGVPVSPVVQLRCRLRGSWECGRPLICFPALPAGSCGALAGGEIGARCAASYASPAGPAAPGSPRRFISRASRAAHALLHSASGSMIRSNTASCSSNAVSWVFSASTLCR
jgi:hypothetical protein